jgi:hypothetical protein
MITKLATFRGISPTGEPLVQLFEPELSLTKVAGPLMPEVRQWMNNYKPSSDKIAVLVNAMGSSEYWGQNVNGDIFPEAALIHDCRNHKEMGHPVDDFNGKVIPPYGFWTFLQALPFVHHRNKDPNRAFGHVALSVWNARMHRVELIVILDKALAMQHGAQDVVDRILAGEYPDVSMGCLPAGTLITMADGTRRPIENIVEGDRVLTHRGRARKVTKLHRRAYKGDLYSVRAEAHELIRSTMDHPFLTVSDSEVKTSDSYRRWKDSDQKVKTDWTHAKCLDGVHLLEPVLKFEDTVTPDYVTRAFARLFGYYLAEGHVLRNHAKELVGVEFTTHKDDAIHLEIESLCSEFGTKNVPVSVPRANSENAVSVSVFDQRLALLCLQHGGSYAKKKKLSEEAIHWHPDAWIEILGAYANGDGCGNSDGSLGLSTASTDLAWQLTLLLPRLGIIASIQNLTHKAGSGFSTHVTYEWVLHLGKQYAQKLIGFCAKVKPVEILKAKVSRKVFSDGESEFVVAPIRDFDSIYAELEVFNLEVEEDESYVASGLVMHNCRVPYDVCSICSNKSKTRNDYCACVKQIGMGRVLDDGRRIGVYNYHPRFFDISFVFIGADKTAKVMCKLASGIVVPQSVADAELVYGASNDDVGILKSAAYDPADDADTRLLMGRIDDQESPTCIGDGTMRTNLGTRDEEDSAGVDRTNSMKVPVTPPKPDPRLTAPVASKGQDRRPELAGSVLAKEAFDPSKALYKLRDRRTGLSELFELAKAIKVGQPPSPNRKKYPFVGTIEFRGLTVHVENRPGDVREGEGPRGKWRTQMKLPYGEILGSRGTDRDKLDVYVGPHRSAENVYIIHQNFVGGPQDGKYDEDKVMLGFDSLEQAKNAYLSHYTSPKYFRSVTTMAFPLFKRAILGKEVHGEKVASVWRRNVADLKMEDEFSAFNETADYAEKCAASLEDLFSGAGTARRRQRTWRDEVTKKETNVTGSGMESFDKVKQASANPELLKVAHVLHYGWSPEDILKVSNELKTATHLKWADIVKRIGPSKAVGRVTPLLSAAEPELPAELLNKLGEEKDLKKSLATPALMGMMLKPKEFQRIILIHIGNKDLADKMDNAGAVIPSSKEEAAPCESLCPEHLDESLLKTLMPFLEGKSYMGPVVRRRIIQITVSKPSSHPEHKEVDSPLLSKVASAYTWYRKEVMKLARALPATVSSHPELQAQVFGMSAEDLFSKTAEGQLPLNARTLAVLLGSVPLSLLYSAHKKSEMEQGKDTGLLGSLIAEHPWLTSMGVVTGLGALLRDPHVQQAVDEAFNAGHRIREGKQLPGVVVRQLSGHSARQA